jgi:hypothetical protein
VARKIAGSVVIVLLLLYLLTLVLHISGNIDNYLWDFQTHREAGKIFASGANPYDSENLPPNVRRHFLYTYPPVTLFLYQLFSLMDYKTAAHVFLILKCLLLIGLVCYWKRGFLREDAGPFFYIYCLLVFNSAVFLDMIAGNINLIEQVLLWVAFGFYIQKRLLWFCIFVLIAAGFKMTPTFFITLVLLTDDKNKYKLFIGSAGAFVAYLLVQYVILPEYFVGFIKNALTVVGEPGQIGPSTPKFVRAVFKVLGDNTGIYAPEALQMVIVGLIVCGVVYLTYRAASRLKHSRVPNREITEVVLVCLLYAQIHPRMKDYMYLLLILPSYYVLKNTRFTRLAPILFILFILSADRLHLPIFSSMMSLLWAYYPLMIAYCVWGIFLYEIFALANETDESGAYHKNSTRSR